MTSLEVLRFMIGGAFLAYASVLDLRTRRVPNNVWIALGSLATLLFLYDWFGTGRFNWVTALVAVGLWILMYGLWYVHILAGGADAKALMALSILLPEPLHWNFARYDMPLWESPMPGALVVLANSVVVFALAPLALLVYNLARGDLHVPTMFLGYTRTLEWARDRFVWVVDRVDADGRRRRVLFPSRMSDEEYNANLDRLASLGVTKVWVTPKIPFMVPLLVGFIATFFVGDFLFHVVSLVVERVRG